MRMHLRVERVFKALEQSKIFFADRADWRATVNVRMNGDVVFVANANFSRFTNAGVVKIVILQASESLVDFPLAGCLIFAVDESTMLVGCVQVDYSFSDHSRHELTQLGRFGWSCRSVSHQSYTESDGEENEHDTFDCHHCCEILHSSFASQYWIARVPSSMKYRD